MCVCVCVCVGVHAGVRVGVCVCQSVSLSVLCVCVCEGLVCVLVCVRALMCACFSHLTSPIGVSYNGVYPRPQQQLCESLCTSEP